jgi:hypothetical protein
MNVLAITGNLVRKKQNYPGQYPGLFLINIILKKTHFGSMILANTAAIAKKKEKLARIAARKA